MPKEPTADTEEKDFLPEFRRFSLSQGRGSTEIFRKLIALASEPNHLFLLTSCREYFSDRTICKDFFARVDEVAKVIPEKVPLELRQGLNRTDFYTIIKTRMKGIPRPVEAPLEEEFKDISLKARSS